MVIPRSSKPDRIHENFDLFDFQLSQEQMHTISAARLQLMKAFTKLVTGFITCLTQSRGTKESADQKKR